MEPLTLLTWIGVIALSIVIIAITALVVWAVMQTIRGRSTKPGELSTVIMRGRS